MAPQMNRFYDSLTEQERESAQDVARSYGRHFFGLYKGLLEAKEASTSPYYVGLSSEMGGFTHVTKRVVLVTDTVLMSGHGTGGVQDLGEYTTTSYRNMEGQDLEIHTNRRYGMVATDLVKLGQWLLDAEPLLRSGLVWYGPVYIKGSPVENFDLRWNPSVPLPSSADHAAVDFVVKHGRAVDLSRAKPLASRVVRPILEIDLPFIDGLALSDFAKVTREEFDSYTQYRDFMRSRLLELDDALEAVDSQVALERVALSIRDELNAATAEMSRAARSQALIRSGAVLGSTSAILAAVRPDALQGALATSATLAAGATGLWPTIQAFADSKPKRTNGKWHYVWVLQKKAAR
ncbi:hypothetical protein [Streptomyces sp. IB2014 016-6]|uniref:hypothetical protein n=1 Tax=Streptomyces sp. IB2014 016-6 TaxID=2517818 RepID=UPI0011C8A03C|nr:hypothetical protein [Streptomyces sp. IB2014 016-6]TXL83652.1 hypothetical protein EW053_36885 [Streptomyces sp. IB2014 016-6]